MKIFVYEIFIMFKHKAHYYYSIIMYVFNYTIQYSTIQHNGYRRSISHRLNCTHSPQRPFEERIYCQRLRTAKNSNEGLATTLTDFDKYSRVVRCRERKPEIYHDLKLVPCALCLVSCAFWPITIIRSLLNGRAAF